MGEALVFVRIFHHSVYSVNPVHSGSGPFLVLMSALWTTDTFIPVTTRKPTAARNNVHYTTTDADVVIICISL